MSWLGETIYDLDGGRDVLRVAAWCHRNCGRAVAGGALAPLAEVSFDAGVVAPGSAVSCPRFGRSMPAVFHSATNAAEVLGVEIHRFHIGHELPDCSRSAYGIGCDCGT